jgi:hypothetical protein
VTILPGNPNTGPLRDFPPGPHSGVDTDPDTHIAPDSMFGPARNALGLGLLSLVFSVVTGIPAIWVGAKALSRMNAADDALKGRWAAWTGILLGCLSVVVLVTVWFYLHAQA